MNDQEPDTEQLSDPKPSTDYSDCISSILSEMDIDLSQNWIDSISRKITIYAEDHLDEKLQDRLHDTGGRHASASINRLQLALSKFKDTFYAEVIDPEKSNPYTCDRLIRAYCGVDTGTSYTPTDALIDRLMQLSDLQKLEAALKEAAQDDGNGSGLMHYGRGKPTDNSGELQLKILAILHENAKPFSKNGKKSISKAKLCETASRILRKTININVTSKTLQNKFSRPVK